MHMHAGVLEVINLYHFAWILFILTDFVGEFFTVLHVEVELGEDITTAQRRLWISTDVEKERERNKLRSMFLYSVTAIFGRLPRDWLVFFNEQAVLSNITRQARPLLHSKYWFVLQLSFDFALELLNWNSRLPYRFLFLYLSCLCLENVDNLAMLLARDPGNHSISYQREITGFSREDCTWSCTFDSCKDLLPNRFSYILHGIFKHRM